MSLWPPPWLFPATTTHKSLCLASLPGIGSRLWGSVDRPASVHGNVLTDRQESQGQIGWAHGFQVSGVSREAPFGRLAPWAHTWLFLSLFCDDDVGGVGVP